MRHVHSVSSLHRWTSSNICNERRQLWAILSCLVLGSCRWRDSAEDTPAPRLLALAWSREEDTGPLQWKGGQRKAIITSVGAGVAVIRNGTAAGRLCCASFASTALPTLTAWPGCHSAVVCHTHSNSEQVSCRASFLTYQRVAAPPAPLY